MNPIILLARIAAFIVALLFLALAVLGAHAIGAIVALPTKVAIGVLLLIFLLLGAIVWFVGAFELPG